MTSFTKKMICLAKSRKTGGFCVAGKEILNDGTVGQWLRPISARDTEEIFANECRFENGHQPMLFICSVWLCFENAGAIEAEKQV